MAVDNVGLSYLLQCVYDELVTYLTDWIEKNNFLALISCLKKINITQYWVLNFFFISYKYF